MQVTMTEWPTEEDWLEVKRRALKTVGFTKVKTPPDEAWKHKILNARHSPIRRLRFSFDITCSTATATHLVRHIHAQPYVKSNRPDRTDSNEVVTRETPVDLIWDLNGEELMIVANKRLCNLAAEETQAVVIEMCKQVLEKCPEYKGLLVPTCGYTVYCPEMYPCGKKTVEF